MHVRDDASDIVRQAVARAKQVARQGTLLRISFETLFEYIKVSGGLIVCLLKVLSKYMATDLENYNFLQCDVPARFGTLESSLRAKCSLCQHVGFKIAPLHLAPGNEGFGENQKVYDPNL